MKSRPSRSLAIVLTMAALGLVATTGCPPAEDDAENQSENANAHSNHNNDREQVAACDVTAVNPGSLALDAAEHSLQLQLLCDVVPPESQFGDAINFRGERTREGEATLAVAGVDCAAIEDLQQCTLSLHGLSAPTGRADENVGLEELTLEDTSGQQLVAPIRWALSPEQLAGFLPVRDISALPLGFLERGVDLHVKETETARIIAGVMRTEAGDGMELFTIDSDGDVTVHATVGVTPEDLTGFSAEMALVGGKAEFEWWGFNAEDGEFTGTTLLFGLDGELESDEPLDSSGYSGPELSELLGVSFAAGDAPGGQRLHGTALMRTANNTLAVVRLGHDFDPDAVILSNQFDALGSTAAGELGEDQVGLISLRDALGQVTPRIWHVDADRQFHLRTTSGEPLGSASLAHFGVQYPFTLEVRATSETQLLVETSWENQDASGSIEIDGEGMVNGKTNHLNLPENCRPSGLQAFLASSPSHLTFACNDTATGAALRVEWTGLTGEPSEMATEPSMVTPLVPTQHSGLTAGDLALRTILPDGTMRLDNVTDLSTSCSAVGDCSLPVSDFTPDGWRLNLTSGTTGSTWSVAACCGGGDILIDGVPLCCEGPPWEEEGEDIDLSLTDPPMIVDAPGASAAGDVAMILANLDHNEATHAVWIVSAEGQISAPGLLKIDTGDANTGMVFQSAESEDKGDDDEAQDMTLTIATTIVDFTKDGDDEGGEGSHEAAGTFTITTAELAAAIGADEPLSLHVDNPSFVTNEQVRQSSLIPPATRIATDANGSHENTEVLATLTAAQAARPLVFTAGSDGLVMRSSGGDEDDAPLEVLIDAEPVGSENPIFIGGAGPGSNILSRASTDGTGFTGKIKRIAIKKRRVGSNLHASSRSDENTGSAVYEVVVEELTIPDALAGEELHLLETGDFNGDGLEDLVVRSRERSGAIILFDDGAGGLASDILEIPGGPTTVFPPGANAATAGNGKGTRKASLQLVSNTHVELL